MQNDPVGFVNGINLLEYVGGKPTIFTDPLGLFFKKDHHRIIGGLDVGGYSEKWFEKASDQIDEWENTNPSSTTRYHYTRRLGQTPEEAEKEYLDYIEDIILRAESGGPTSTVTTNSPERQALSSEPTRCTSPASTARPPASRR
jgi:hypothetical protein